MKPLTDSEKKVKWSIIKSIGFGVLFAVILIVVMLYIYPFITVDLGEFVDNCEEGGGEVFTDSSKLYCDCPCEDSLVLHDYPKIDLFPWRCCS